MQPAPMQPETVQPAPKQPLSSRLAEIDILKGVALLGILLVNFAGFNSSLFSAMPGGGLVTASGGRDVAALVVNWLVQGKFILIFAFLLGWSTYVQARQEGGFRGRWLRRLLGLLLLGVAHGIFLFSGDILATYALLGLFMLRPVARDWPARRVVRSAVILGAVSIAILAALSALLVAFPSGPDDAPLFSDAARIYASGTFLEVSRQRALEFAVQVLVVVLLFGPMLLAAMRLGFAAAMTYAGAGVEALGRVGERRQHGAGHCLRADAVARLYLRRRAPAHTVDHGAPRLDARRRGPHLSFRLSRPVRAHEPHLLRLWLRPVRQGVERGRRPALPGGVGCAGCRERALVA